MDSFQLTISEIDSQYLSLFHSLEQFNSLRNARERFRSSLIFDRQIWENWNV